ncbi:MAG: (d)CMP kinase [Phycisphaerales bacterium]
MSDQVPATSAAGAGPVRRGPLAHRRRVIITIDGPAGTGKSSVARVLARRLGLEFLDTGAMYRAAAALAVDRGIAVTDHAGIVEAVSRTDLHFDWTTDPPTLLSSGVSVMERIRDKDITAVVSPIAGIAGLRALMVRMQRQIGAAHPRLVTEGRDQGSIVFPDADVKVFMFAAPEVRAARRAQQLRAAGQAVDEAALVREIIERDQSDASRTDGPLVCPEGAERFDTSAYTFDEVVDRLYLLVLTRLEEASKKNETGLALSAS